MDLSPSTVIEFVEGEYILARGLNPPETGWQLDDNPNIDQANKSDQALYEYRTMVGRFYFDRESIESDPTAIYTIGTRGNFSVFVNGKEVFRNFADVSDPKNSWYRPFLVRVPTNVLKHTLNEIVIHSFSRKNIGIGRLLIGSNAALQAHYRAYYFWHVSAPKAANFAMLLLGLLVFTFWLSRRQEIELLWLFIASALWFLRNHQYYADAIPFDATIYTAITIYATYFAIAASAAFYFCFIKLSHRKRIIVVMFLAGIPLVLIHYAFSMSSIVLYIPTTIVTFMVSILGVRDLLVHRDIERGLVGGRDAVAAHCGLIRPRNASVLQRRRSCDLSGSVLRLNLYDRLSDFFWNAGAGRFHRLGKIEPDTRTIHL